MKQGTIKIKNLFGGWVSTPNGTATTSLAASVEGREGQYGSSTAISLFRLERLGHIAPGEVFSPMTDASTRINQLPLNGGVVSTGAGLMVLANSRVVRTTTLDNPSTDANDDVGLVSGHSGHSAVETTNNPDIVVFKDRAGTEYAIITYSDNTDADGALVNASGTITDDDFFSTLSGSGALTRGVPLKIAQGPDGNIYITNGKYIASIVTSGNTVITSAVGDVDALALGSGWVASGICAYKDKLAIVGYKAVTYITGVTRSECRVWMWDMTSTTGYNFAFDIPDNYASGIYFDGKDLLAFTNGRNNSSKIFRFNGLAFELAFESTLLSPSGTPRQGGLESYQNSVHIASGTGVYQYFAGGLHHRMVLTDGTNVATSVGMLKNLEQNKLFAGVTITGPAYRVYYQDQFTEYYPNATLRTRLYTLPYRSNLRKIIVYFSQFGAGASFTLTVFNDYATSSIFTQTITNATEGAITSKEFIITGSSRINSFYLDLTFDHSAQTNTAAIVREIEAIYETD